jgi:hypothetical protein
MAGIGKSVLTVHAAHALKQRFPDGQVFLPRHAHTVGQQPSIRRMRWPACSLPPVSPLTRSLPGCRHPECGARLAYKRLLLLLEDEAGHEQRSRPAATGHSVGLVLITGQRHLTALNDLGGVSQ